MKKKSALENNRSYLFIDTASGTRCLLRHDGNYYYGYDGGLNGSETLVPLIDGLLNQANIKISDIDVFGCCIGPGSFTGLRIAVTTIKTFCYALKKRCFTVDSLRLNSYCVKAKKVISIADAGNNVCYIARYNGEKEEDAPRCVTMADAEIIVERYADYTVVTDEKLKEKFNATNNLGKDEMILAAEKEIDNAKDESEVAPLYIRKPQPERKEGDL